jgi:hypothetical protein
MKKQEIKIQTVAPDDALRVGDFSLLPDNPRPPVITSHPIRNFVQLTWASLNPDGLVELKPVNPVVDTFTVRKGTRVKWALYCVDPSNINNINDTSNLTFIWKKDGQSLFYINNQNDGMGSSEIEYTEDECTGLIDGQYTCEVSNEFGTTRSVPFTLQVIDLDDNPNLYTNILNNGDGEGGLDNWTDNTGKIKAIVSSKSQKYHPNVMTRYQGQPYRVLDGSAFPADYVPPTPFKFDTQIAWEQLFYSGYLFWKNNYGPDIDNMSIPTDANMQSKFPEWYRWINISNRFSTIPNEDATIYDNSIGVRKIDSPQGFFPSSNYIDNYNRNQGVRDGFIPLSEQTKRGNKAKSYFTRDLINFGETDTVRFAQTINLSETAGMIDGQVGGVDYMTAQFFSYVGIALSRYKIRYTDQDGAIQERPWLVHDFETYKKWLRDGPNTVAKIPYDRAKGFDIIPCTDDTTSIKITCFDLNGNKNKEEVLKGPEAIDLWAVKEKIDISLMLFPLYAFFSNSTAPDCPVRFFGQTHTLLNTFYKLTVGSENYPTGLLDRDVIEADGWNGYKAGYETDQIKDINMTFLMKRYGEFYKGRTIPRDVWKRVDPNNNDWYTNVVNDSAKGFGIDLNETTQAWFGVGANIDLPVGTREVNIEVSFTNNSPARNDSSPEAKGWNKQEIYNSLHRVDGAVTVANSDPFYAYGEPRCAITSMKMMVVPNRDIASEKHTTYAIPPSNATVAGLSKQAIQRPIWNAVKPGAIESYTFEYPLIQPGGVPESPEPDTDTIEVLKEAFNQSQVEESEDSIPVSDRFSAKESKAFGAASIDQEGIDQENGE